MRLRMLTAAGHHLPIFSSDCSALVPLAGAAPAALPALSHLHSCPSSHGIPLPCPSSLQPIAPHTPPRVLLASTGLLAPTALARTAPSSRANSVASGVSISTASLPSSHPVPLTSWAGQEGPMSHPLTEEGAAPSPTADAPSSAAAYSPAGPRAHSPAALTAEAVRVVSVTPLGERPAAAKVGV